MKPVRGLLAGALALGLLLAPSVARADHHFMMINEVHAGGTATPESEYLEMQMWAGGQINVAPYLTVRVYDAAGAQVYSETFDQDVDNGQSQRTILSGVSSFSPDLVFDALPAGYMAPTGGAACITSSVFDVLDCVAWGNFIDTTTTDPEITGVGTPEAAIPDDTAIERTHARACATQLDPADDTNDSNADFAPAATPTPRTNSTAITETPCTGPPPGGGSTTPANPTPTPAAPKKKCKKGRKLKKGKCVRKKRKK
jgi:hypothetical protein